MALIGLGSVGLERQRVDAYSDLDFFAVVEPGYKRAYMGNLDWLRVLCPIAYSFQNTADGYKLLFADGIFCEFAVFEPQELPNIPFSPGRMVWRQTQADEALGRPAKAAEPPGFEQRYPGTAANLADWTQGYTRNRESALRILAFLEQHFSVNRAMAMAIRNV